MPEELHGALSGLPFSACIKSDFLNMATPSQCEFAQHYRYDYNYEDISASQSVSDGHAFSQSFVSTSHTLSHDTKMDQN